MLKKIDSIIDKHLGDSCLILGSGPTLDDFDFGNFKGKILLAGNTILRIDKEKIKPDYLITSNNHFPVVNIQSHLNFINSFEKLTWILSDTGCHNDIWKFDEKLYNNLKPNHIFFDDRHFGGIECNPRKECCNFLKKYPNRYTLLEVVEKKFNSNFNFKKKNGCSIADATFMVATLMGFEHIFIQGVDLPLMFYKGKQKNIKYYGYQNLNADKFEDETNKIIKKKYFFYYLKKMDFKPYLQSFFKQIYNYFFNKDYSLFQENFDTSINIFQWLTEINIKLNRKVFYLSKESNLKKVKNLTYKQSQKLNLDFQELFN
mgnify:FL=1